MERVQLAARTSTLKFELRCGPHCTLTETPDGPYVEHTFAENEGCYEHRGQRGPCILHGGIHYHVPVKVGMIRDLREPE